MHDQMKERQIGEELVEYFLKNDDISSLYFSEKNI